LTILASFLSSSVSYLGSPRARHSFPTRRSSDLAGDEVRGVRELHAAVADGAAPEFVQQVRFCPRLLTDRDVVPRQQPVVAVLVGDDFHLGHELGVLLDQPSDCRGEAGGKATGGEEGNLRDFWRRQSFSYSAGSSVTSRPLS